MLVRSFLITVMLFSAVSISTAQETQQVLTHARPGYATKTIFVIGAVGQPGIWRVEESTGLLELLTIVRLTGIGATGRGARQDAVIRIHRGSADSRREIYRGKLQDVIDGAGQNPSLLDGDVLTVETKTRIGLTSVATWAGSAASLVLLVLRIMRLS